MSKLSEKQIVVGSVCLFATLYIAIHTTAITDFFTVIRPFINGFVLAYLTDIFATRIEKKIPFKKARGISIVSVYVIFFGIVTLLFVYMMPILVQNVQLFAQKLPNYIGDSPLSGWEGLFENFSFSDVTPRLANQLLEATQYARAATSSLVNGVLSFVVSVYVLLTKEGIVQFGSRLIHGVAPAYAPSLRRKINKSHHTFKQFLFAQLVASLLLGVLAGFVLFALGAHYAILIATIIGLSNVVPLVGAVLGVFVSMLVLFLTNPPLLALSCFVFLLLLQQIDATVITPKLMGNVLNLNPIVVILVLALGTAYWGVVGILFAIPVTVIIKETVRERLFKE